MDKGLTVKNDHKDGDQVLSRRQSRRFALQVLFCNDFLKEDIDKLTVRVAETLDYNIDEFGNSLIQHTRRIQDELDHIIIEGLIDKNIDRVPLLEKVIIRIALCELLCFPDIPVEVTLNEAVDLSKEFVSLKSSRFVNGILDSLVKLLEKEQKINKSLIARLPSRKSKIQKRIKDVKL
jgi:N utilization substance protein B